MTLKAYGEMRKLQPLQLQTNKLNLKIKKRLT